MAASNVKEIQLGLGLTKQSLKFII